MNAEQNDGDENSLPYNNRVTFQPTAHHIIMQYDTGTIVKCNLLDPLCLLLVHLSSNYAVIKWTLWLFSTNSLY